MTQKLSHGCLCSFGKKIILVKTERVLSDFDLGDSDIQS